MTTSSGNSDSGGITKEKLDKQNFEGRHPHTLPRNRVKHEINKLQKCAEESILHRIM